MHSRNLAMGIMFLSQSIVGALGNLSLFSHYLVAYYNEHTLKPIDFILTHLITANCLLIISKGVPHTLATLGIKLSFNDIMCELLLYTQRLGRSMSMGTTCLLSVYQVITISAQKAFWKNLKLKLSNYIGLFISIFWFLYSTVNFIFPLFGHIRKGYKNATVKRDFTYCSTVGYSKILESLYISLLVFPEVLFSVLIIWSSTSMTVILYRHNKQIQHIRCTQHSPRNSPEYRATQSILILVSSYVVFYTFSSILQGFVAVLTKYNWWLVNITAFISMCFPTLCPFVVSHNFIVLRFCLH